MTLRSHCEEDMKKYFIDLSGVSDRDGFHRRLQESIPVPDWYGNNLDALYDVLTEMPEPVQIRILGWQELAEAEPLYFDRVRRVFRDAHRETPGLDTVFEEKNGAGSDPAEEADRDAAEGFAGPGPEAAAEKADRDAVKGFTEPGTEAGSDPPVPAGIEKPGRTLVITDLHGCLDECKNLLAKMGFDEETDTLVNLGDTIDRGPKIYETFVFLRELKERMGDRCVLIRGNHEQMLLDAAWTGGRNKDLWYYNKGDKTVFSFLHHKHRYQEYLDWYEDMPYYYVTDKYNCVHASLLDPDPEKNETDTLLWGRDTAYEGKLVLTGHTPYRAPIFFQGESYGRIQEDVWTVLPETGMIALDTGCVYGNRLTGMTIRDDGTFLVTSVPSGVKDDAAGRGQSGS